MTLGCRWILSMVAVCLASVSVLAAEGFTLSVASDRDTYISGMTATFTVVLTHRDGSPVDLANKKLVATFPDTATEVVLTQASSQI